MKLEIVNGCFSYQPQRPILHNISFSLDDGQILSVLGLNGIGKTTLLKCLTGILKWQSGQTFVDGKALPGICCLDKVSYVPQAHSLPFPYTALDMVCMGRAKKMGFFAVPSRRDKELALESLEIVGMASMAERRCSEMSGGQLQLVFLARALAGEPELLVLDEPESHLDFKNQALVLGHIVAMSREKKISCIVNTHDPEHALRISDCTLLLGQTDHLFGTTETVLTEANIQRFFGVKSRIVDLAPMGISSKAFILMK